LYLAWRWQRIRKFTKKQILTNSVFRIPLSVFKKGVARALPCPTVSAQTLSLSELVRNFVSEATCGVAGAKAPVRPSRRRFFFEFQRKEKTAAGLQKALAFYTNLIK